MQLKSEINSLSMKELQINQRQSNHVQERGEREHERRRERGRKQRHRGRTQGVA